MLFNKPIINQEGEVKDGVAEDSTGGDAKGKRNENRKMNKKRHRQKVPSWRRLLDKDNSPEDEDNSPDKVHH
jgi:hypothetical protein